MWRSQNRLPPPLNTSPYIFSEKCAWCLTLVPRRVRQQMSVVLQPMTSELQVGMEVQWYLMEELQIAHPMHTGLGSNTWTGLAYDPLAKVISWSFSAVLMQYLAANPYQTMGPAVLSVLTADVEKRDRFCTTMENCFVPHVRHAADIFMSSKHLMEDPGFTDLNNLLKGAGIDFEKFCGVRIWPLFYHLVTFANAWSAGLCDRLSFQVGFSSERSLPSN